MSLSPVQIETLVAIAQKAEAAPHGQRGAIYEQGAVALGVSVRTLHNWLDKVTLKNNRKQRNDKGEIVLSREEALLISAMLSNSERKTGKQLSSIKLAVKRLRANNKVLAGRYDENTGEFFPLSESAISRALYAYRLHPSQLRAAAPATPLASKHPNHVWQIDATVSAQYYIEESGTQEIDKTIHYIGKPEQMEKLLPKLLVHYTITDHTSGAIYAEYVVGAENAKNLISCLVNCMIQRDNQPFYGVPTHIMTDPGSAMKGNVFKNFCRNMGIDLIINKVGNARAKGQVEKANDIVEREFESGLKLVDQVKSLDELNRLARQWMKVFNATEEHSRHGMTRNGSWQRIKPEQLRIAPSREICLEMAIAAPESRKVNVYLHIPFGGQFYDVHHVPDVFVGVRLLVAKNPYKQESIQVVLKNEEGRDYFIEAPLIQYDENGFPIGAAVIGENYKKQADTLLDRHRKEIEQTITGTRSETEAKAARKAKKVAFNGEIDPFKHITDAVLPVYLPKQGTEIETKVILPTVEEVKLSPTLLAKQLKEQLPSWSSEHMKWLRKNYPDGAPESELNTILEAITQKVSKRPQLSVVGE